MGAAQRKKLAGNMESDPNWKKTRKLTNKEIGNISQAMSKDFLNDLLFDYKDSLKLMK